MSNMVRKQIYLRKKQVQILKNRAAASGVSESELIRRALDESLSGVNIPAYTDPSALKEIETFIRALKAEKPKGAPIQFDRDEIYNERLDRYGLHPD